MPLSRLCESLENLKRYADGYDYLLTGHGVGFDTPELIDRIEEAAKAVLAGKTDRQGPPMERMGRSFPTYLYTGENDRDAALVYRPDLVR